MGAGGAAEVGNGANEAYGVFEVHVLSPGNGEQELNSARLS
jgi:hypothetical protein